MQIISNHAAHIMVVPRQTSSTTLESPLFKIWGNLVIPDTTATRDRIRGRDRKQIMTSIQSWKIQCAIPKRSNVFLKHKTRKSFMFLVSRKVQFVWGCNSTWWYSFPVLCTLLRELLETDCEVKLFGPRPTGWFVELGWATCQDLPEEGLPHHGFSRLLPRVHIYRKWTRSRNDTLCTSHILRDRAKIDFVCMRSKRFAKRLCVRRLRHIR